MAVELNHFDYYLELFVVVGKLQYYLGFVFESLDIIDFVQNYLNNYEDLLDCSLMADTIVHKYFVDF